MSDRLDSWQAHLEDISCYLVQGEGEWWKATNEGFEFFDTDHQQRVRPALQHYRTSGFLDVKAMNAGAWQHIIRCNTLLPTPSIKVYDNDGNFISHKTFTTCANNSYTTAEVPMDITQNTDAQNVDESTSESVNECDEEYIHAVSVPLDFPMSLDEVAG